MLKVKELKEIIEKGEYEDYNPKLTTKCEKPYMYSPGQKKCVLPTGLCVFDKDCGTPRCSGDTKIVPRCDITSNKCETKTERVNCKTEYGTDYECKNGECIRQRKSYTK